MSARTLVVGEALIDVVRSADGSQREHPGGSPLNVAVGLSRLGHPATLATFVADDPYGGAIRAHLAADNVTLAPGSDQAPRTATATAILDENSSATYEFDIAWDLTPPADDFDHLHTGSIAAVLQPGATTVRAIAEAARTHATVSYDPNLRPSLMGQPHDVRSDIEQLVGLSDVVKASDEDVAWLYGVDAPLPRVAQLWSQLGPSLIVVTRGPAGALIHLSRSGEFLDVPGQSVDVVDTVGAGDSFMSGLLSGLLDAGLLGAPAARDRLRQIAPAAVRPAVDRAITTSAITVSRAGAQPPTRAEL